MAKKHKEQIVGYESSWYALNWWNYPGKKNCYESVQSMKIISISDNIEHCQIWQSSLDAVIFFKNKTSKICSIKGETLNE